MAVEDFTTYTEVDPNLRITVSPNLVDADGVRRNEDAYVYKDKGVDYFTDFTHNVDVRSPSYAGIYGCILVWGVSNVVDDAYAWLWGFTVEVYGYSSSQYDIRFRTKGGTGGWGNGVHSTNKFNYGTWVYLKIIRQDTSLKCEIYSDPARTNLLETLELTVGADEKYRYIYACSSWNTNTTHVFNADIQNLDLVPTAYIISGITRDADGNPLGGCTVWLFKTSDKSFIEETTSDVNGNYSFTVGDNTTQFFIRAYKDGTPNVFGTTDDNLTGI